MDFWNKNIGHLYNFINYIVEHLLCIVVVVIILILSGIILVNLPKVTPIDFENQEILILGVTLTNWQIWYTFVGLIITAIWSIYQYTKNIARKQQEKGASIAKEFSQGLLEKCGLVTVVYKKSELYKLLNAHQEYTSFKNFTTNELRDVYGNDFPTLYKEIEDKSNLDYIYYEILNKRISPLKKENKNSSENLNVKNQLSKEKEKENENDKEVSINFRELFILDNKDLPFHFGSLVDDVLNELELICMDISSQAAGSKYIYQSLHQMFFRTVKILSIEICLRNNGKYCDKFYTNIIHVYNEWTKRYKRDLKKENKRKKAVDKILNPKIKTV